MANKSTLYFTPKGITTIPKEPSDHQKQRSLSDTVYDYQAFASEASESSAQFAARIQEWSDQVNKWNKKKPDSPSRQRAAESALTVFRTLEKSKIRAEDRRDALSSRLKTLPTDLDDEKEQGFKKTLEDHHETLQIACQSMAQQLPYVQDSLEKLRGFGDKSLSTSLQRIIGKTPHIPPASRSPKVISKPDENYERKKPETTTNELSLSSFVEDEYQPLEKKSDPPTTQ